MADAVVMRRAKLPAVQFTLDSNGIGSVTCHSEMGIEMH
jgi:hypothetical protein